MSRQVTITLNDREAKRIDLIKQVMKCSDEAAIIIVLAACSKENIAKALRMFIPQESVGV